MLSSWREQESRESKVSLLSLDGNQQATEQDNDSDDEKTRQEETTSSELRRVTSLTSINRTLSLGNVRIDGDEQQAKVAGTSVPFGDDLGITLDEVMEILVDPDEYKKDEEELWNIMRDRIESDDWKKLEIHIKYWKLFPLARKLTQIYDAPMFRECSCEEPCPVECRNATPELVGKGCAMDGCRGEHGRVLYEHQQCGEVICSRCATVLKLMVAIQIQAEGMEDISSLTLDDLPQMDSLARSATTPRIATAIELAAMSPNSSERPPTSRSSGMMSWSGRRSVFQESDTAFQQRWRLAYRLMKRELDIQEEYHDPDDWPHWMKTPELIRYIDVDAFGWIPDKHASLSQSSTWDLWHYAMEELHIKNRPEYWNILEFLSTELKAGRFALDHSLETLIQYRVESVSKLCMAVSMSSVNAMATSLYYAAFMSAKAEEQPNRRDDFQDASLQLIELSKKMLATIDSDHLAMFLLELPTDLGGTECLSPMDIALNNKLDDFLDDQRILRVGQRVWTDFYKLDPKSQFLTSKLSIHQLFRRLVVSPHEFYFTPMGQFVVSTTMFVMYTVLFSWVTYQRRYDYHPFSHLDIAFWIVNFGFVSYEFLELMLGIRSYFKELSNYFDFTLSVIFITLFIQRVFRHASGELTEEQMKNFRNSKQTEFFMGLWALACILMWSRLAILLRRSESFGPFLQMVFNMVRDISVFSMIAMLFFIGFAFAVYFIVAGDAPQTLPGMREVSLYIFQTLNGQQDWGDFDELQSTDNVRLNMAKGIVGIFTVFASIMLLNLLIAMMATTYDNVREQSRKENNFAGIWTAYSTERNTSLIGAPLNLIAMTLAAVYIGLDFVVWIGTAFYYQLNEEWWSPLAWSTYNINDVVEYEIHLRERDNRVLKRRGRIIHVYDDEEKVTPPSIAQRAKRLGNTSLPRNDVRVADLRGEHTQRDISEFSICKIEKSFFRSYTSSLSASLLHEQCPFCYYRISHNRRGNIKKFFHTFREQRLRLDESDTEYLEHILNEEDEFGNAIHLTHSICPNCFRPYRDLRSSASSTHESSDRITRFQYVLEIVSFWVFIFSIYVPLLIFIAIPAAFSYVLSRINAEEELDYKKYSRIENESQFREIVKAQLPRMEDLGDQMDRVFARFKRIEDMIFRNRNEVRNRFDEQKKDIELTDTDVNKLFHVMKEIEVLKEVNKKNTEMVLMKQSEMEERLRTNVVNEMNERLLRLENVVEEKNEMIGRNVEGLGRKVEMVEEVVIGESEKGNKMMGDLMGKVIGVEEKVVEKSEMGRKQMDLLSSAVSALDGRMLEVRETTGSLQSKVDHQGVITELTARQLQEQWKLQQEEEQREQEELKRVIAESGRQQAQALETTEKLYQAAIAKQREMEMKDVEDGNWMRPEVVSQVSEKNIEWGQLLNMDSNFSYDPVFIHSSIQETDFAAIDADGNFAVDFDEFKSHFNEIDPVILRVLFEQVDKDHSGELSPIEFVTWKQNKLRIEVVTEIVNKYVPKIMNVLRSQLVKSNELLVEERRKVQEMERGQR